MAEGMEGGERAGSMPAGQLDYLSGIPSPTPSELTDAANMLNDLIYVSSVLLLVAVIAKVLVANVILRQRAEVERLFKMRQQVCSDAKLSQQRTQSTVGIRVFYERRKTDVMAEARQALRVTVLYEEREAAIEILDSQKQYAMEQVEFAHRSRRDAGDENTHSVAERRLALDGERLADVEKELEELLEIDVDESVVITAESEGESDDALPPAESANGATPTEKSG